jgi:bla regulator protein blaR1
MKILEDLLIMLALCAAQASVGTAKGQSAAPEIPAWQVAAGGNLSFEVASVKLSAPGAFHPPSFPLSDDDSFVATGGRLTAVFSLPIYIQFAYKVRLTQEQMSAMLSPLPKWVASDRFDIEARAPGNPSKDQFRLMVQALLAERFQLAVHFETHRGKLFALELVKPGKAGPKLVVHDGTAPCGPPETSAAPAPGDRPPLCGAYEMDAERSGLRHVRSRRTSLELLATKLSDLGDLGRPVIDRTGLAGNFDFTLDYVPEKGGTVPLDTNGDPIGPAFVDALREESGLKLVGIEGPVQNLVVDHVEKPSGN